MLNEFLSENQRHQLNQFPQTISASDIIHYFLLSESDYTIIPVRSPTYSRLGFALSLCALRWLGFIPENLELAPKDVLTFILQQMNLSEIPDNFSQYGSRVQTRTQHILIIENYLNFKRFNHEHQQLLKQWLLVYAMEHDRPTILLKNAIEKLKRDRIVRPPLALLERVIGFVRIQARKQTFELLSTILSQERKIKLDNMLIVDTEKGRTLLTWLRQRAVSHSPQSIRITLDKIKFLEEQDVHEWDLSILNANQIKFLSRLGKCSTNQALQRYVPEKRYSILVAFMHQSLEELIDEAVDLFDQSLSHSYSRAKNMLKKRHEKMQEDINEKIRLLKDIGNIILDESIPDLNLRQILNKKVSLEKLQQAMNDCDQLIRPENDKYLDYFVKRFSYLRQFVPEFLSQLRFQSIKENHSILQAINLLKILNQKGERLINSCAPTHFVNDSWKKYVFQNGKIDRHYYELCVLWELRNTLRSGDIWVDGGRRYNNPEHYLIPRSHWLNIKDDACELLQISQDASLRINDHKQEIDDLFKQLNQDSQQNSYVKVVNEKLVVSNLEADDETVGLKVLRKLMRDTLPKIDLAELLIEIDNWTHFSSCFYHAANQTDNADEVPLYLYAVLLSEATNIGPAAMADIADLDYDRLIWYKNWYIREETLEKARAKLINFQYSQMLSQYFGDGSFSSSDGRRIPMAVKSKTAKAFVKYFGYETGINLYSWTSDQFSQYGCKVIPPTMREATVVLDAILDNETELEIARHTTDTAGYTETIFALFGLLGLQFEPRIKNISDQRIYYLLEKPICPHIDSLITGPINTKLIENNWDDILRLAASLKKGWVSASLFITKLQALPRKSNLAKALQEYGKIQKTIAILRYVTSKKLRKEVSAQLNKGEAVHDLQQFLHLGREGRIYVRQLDEQENHFGCLNLLINSVIIWNTVYMSEIIEQFKNEGNIVDEEDLKHLSPARRKHINPYGKYKFDLSNPLKGRLRPLRNQL